MYPCPGGPGRGLGAATGHQTCLCSLTLPRPRPSAASPPLPPPHRHHHRVPPPPPPITCFISLSQSLTHHILPSSQHQNVTLPASQALTRPASSLPSPRPSLTPPPLAGWLAVFSMQLMGTLCSCHTSMSTLNSPSRSLSPPQSLESLVSSIESSEIKQK